MAMQCTEIDNNLIKESRFVESFELHKCKLASRRRKNLMISRFNLDVFQYDAFVKFIDHQIQKRFAESQAPSYLS